MTNKLRNGKKSHINDRIRTLKRNWKVYRTRLIEQSEMNKLDRINHNYTFFSTAAEWIDAGNVWAWRPSRLFFCKLSSLRFFRISTMLSSLRLRPSSASTETLYRFRRTSVLALGRRDIVDGVGELLDSENEKP